MSAQPAPDDHVEPIPIDRRVPMDIPASRLIIDKRTQRDLDPERCCQISNEFDWERMEVPTVSDNSDGTYAVNEGQHRVGAIKLRDELTGTDTVVHCMVLPPKDLPEQAQLGLDIAKGRKGHKAYELWMLRLNARHEHEVLATEALRTRGLRVGRSTSAMTIGAVATVRTIVHGGSHSPEYGTDLLMQTVDVIVAAFPHHDPESNTSRWDRHLLLAVAGLIHRNPGYSPERMITSLRVRPAPQWVAFGQPNVPNAQMVIGAKLMDTYNRHLRRGRLQW